MIINLSKPREEYFEGRNVREILTQFVDKEGPIGINSLRELDQEGQIVTGTKERDLENLLSREHHLDSRQLVEMIENLGSDQLLVLPPEYRIDDYEGRNVLVYETKNLVNLDSMAVKRALLQEKIPKGPLSGVRKRDEKWNPEKVIRTAVHLYHKELDKVIEKTWAGYTWWGKDNHRRIVSLYRSIQGAELRTFQNFAAFRLTIPLMRKELRLGATSRSSYKNPLTGEQRGRRKSKIARYENYLRKKVREGHPIGKYVRKMDVEFSDLIEPNRASFAQHTGKRVRVPSRGRKNSKVREFDITGIPILKDNELDLALSMVWNMRGYCPCEDKRYRSNRRKMSPETGNDEDLFCPHEIAALYTIKRIYKDYTDRSLPMLPFVLPTAKTMDYVEKLRNQTVLLDFNAKSGHSGRFTKRALNHTEMENLLWKLAIVRDYEACFTTRIEKFAQERYDPNLDLVKFR
jgi:hypothetical protein